MAKRVDVRFQGDETVTKAARKATGGITRLNKSVKNAQKTWKDHTVAIGVATAAIAGIGIVLKKAVDIAQYGAQVKQTSMAFESIATDSGAMADEIIDNMRRMSGETINELDMMLAANKASLLGIPVEEFDDLMRIARASATATGGSVQQMFNDIVTGIGRASPMILDNLGITVKIGDANKKYADSLGKTVEELTAQEKKQALLNEVLISGEDIIRKVGEAGQTVTDVEKWQQVTAAAADFRAELGLNLLPVMGSLSQVVAGVFRKAAEALEQIRLVNEAMDEMALKGTLSELQRRYDALTKEIERLEKAQEAGMRTGGRTRKETEDEIIALITQKAKIADTIYELKKSAQAKKEDAGATKDLIPAQDDLNRAYKTGTDDLQEWITKQTEVVAGLGELTQAQLGLTGLMGQFVDKINETNNGLEGLVEEEEKAIEKQIEFADALNFTASALFGLEGIFSQFYTNRLIEIDNDYARRKAAIEANITDEEERTKALEDLDEEFDAKRKQLQRDQAEANRAINIFNATIDTLGAVMKTFATFGWPAGIIPAAIMGGLGAAKVIAITSQPLPEFAKGGDFIVPPGYPNDSYLMRAESGEHVTITPKDQVDRGGFQLLDKIIVRIGKREFEGYIEEIVTEGTENGNIKIDRRVIK